MHSDMTFIMCPILKSLVTVSDLAFPVTVFNMASPVIYVSKAVLTNPAGYTILMYLEVSLQQSPLTHCITADGADEAITANMFHVNHLHLTSCNLQFILIF